MIAFAGPVGVAPNTVKFDIEFPLNAHAELSVATLLQ